MNEIKRGPGRPPRPIREEARRRQTGDHGGNNLKMKAPKIKGFATRWINDEGNRIHDMTVLDDWDFVSKSEITVQGRVSVGDPALDNTIDPGERVSIPVLIGGGQSVKSYLVKKRMDYFKADRAEKDRLHAEKMKGLFAKPGIENERGKVEIN